MVGGKSQAPRGVQRAACGKALNKIAVEVKHVNKATPQACHVVMSVRILHGESHIEIAVDVANAERRESGLSRVRRNSRVRKCLHEGEGSVVHLHDRVTKIGGVDKIPGAVIPVSKAFVNGAKGRAVCSTWRRIVDRQDGIAGIDPEAPTSDCPIFGGEEESSWRRGAVFRNNKIRGAVEDDARGCTGTACP